MAHLRVANLRKSYRINKTEQQEVLKGINVEFNRGEFVAILGESGCGKSTFLNIIAGLDYQYSGSLVLKGEFMKDFDEHQMDDYRKKEVGYVFQSFNLINHNTVEENVAVAMSMSNMPDAEAKKRAKELLAQVGMLEHSKKYPNQLSGGQKQRVAIARAIANDPTIILADEPTGNLDKQSAEEVLAILKDIAVSGKIVICVTHSQKVADECSRVIKIDDGIIVSDEEKKTYKTAKSVKNTSLVHKPKPINTKAVVKISLRNVVVNIKRNVLVTAALSIGIAAFVLMLSLSSGIKNFISVEVGSSYNKYQIDVAYNSSALGEFASSDIKNLEALEGVNKVVKSSTANLCASYTVNTVNYTFLSIASVYEGFSVELMEGELPNLNSDTDILISKSAARKLLYLGGEFESLIGTSIDITIKSKASYTICGIIESTSNYDTAFMTLSALNRMYEGNAPINMVYVLAEDITYISALMSDISYLGYSPSRQDSTVESMLSYVDTGTLLLAGIAIISLIVAAIMIFIVMYTSVIERTKEIGILRTIGARRSDVTKLFLFEAAVIGCAAGFFGGLLSLMMGIVVNLTMASSYATRIVNNNPLFLLIGIVISTLLSIISSISPASLAANADPIECLRNE